MVSGLGAEGVERALSDDRSECSMASNSSSGFSSLTRKGKLDCQAPGRLQVVLAPGKSQVG